MNTLAIVGSHLLDPRQERLATLLVEAFLRNYEYHNQGSWEVISGGAEGVDTIASTMSTEWGIPFRSFLPEIHEWNDHYDPDSGLVLTGFRARNRKIAEACTELLCVRTIRARTYGSAWTADRAEDFGKPVWRYYV